jgi:sulfate adenylyltransferase
MRLADGTLFPIPITLAVEPQADIVSGAEVAITDQRNDLLAIMQVGEIYEWDLEEEAQLVYGTTDVRQPLMAEMHTWGETRYFR